MKKISFYNHYHNGDLLSSKSFIVDIMSKIDTQYQYQHFMHQKVLSDLNLEYAGYPNVSMVDRIIDGEDIVYVNTWIGSYFENDDFYGDLSLLAIHHMFGKIYESLSKIFNVDLKLEHPINYFPKIDYTKFDTYSIDSYLKEDFNTKILFCNGEIRSGQCVYVGDMKDIIEEQAIKNPDKTFIVTKKLDTDIQNIKFTEDIIKCHDGCDLNEISYLSKFCKLIVGRNSGPHCFTIVEDNLMDSEKIFYSFSSYDKKICLPRDLDLNCKFVFEQYTDYETLDNSICELISKI